MNSTSQHFQFPEVRVVQASAGSGKTYALAKRYIQLLLKSPSTSNSIAFRHILAITFTNKAAFEMKGRILEMLKTIALKRMAAKELQAIIEPIGLSADAASDKAYMLMEQLIRHYNFFQVQTIDKFINALLCGCAFKVGLTANFKIKTTAFEYLQQSLDELIDQAASDGRLQRIFNEFLHHYLYLENRTGWFPKKDMTSILYALYQQYNTYGLHFEQSGHAQEDLVKKKILIFSLIEKLHANLPEGANATFVKSLQKFVEKSKHGFDIDSISDFFRHETLPVRKGSQIPAATEELWSSLRQHLRELCEQEACSLFNPYVNIFNQVMGEFSRLSIKDDVLFLEQLNKKVEALFDEGHVTVGELYYRLATRFQHYLIDEFQDTSRLQWGNLETMVEEALSTGGSLYYVGDRKQAIYRFRGGDDRLFEQVAARFNAFNVVYEGLDRNWRSGRAIVEFNNKIFSMENLRHFLNEKAAYEDEKNKKNAVGFNEEDLKALHAVYGASHQEHERTEQEGYVRIECIDAERKQECDDDIRRRLIVLIGELRERFAYKDIAILTRSNRGIEEVTNWLLQENILVDSERTSNVREHPLIAELIAFLYFLQSPIDNVNFVRFIFGKIFTHATGLTERELHDFVFSLRAQLLHEKDTYVYRQFREKYPQVWEKFIDEFFRNIGLYPLYELMVTVYSRFDVLRHFPQAQGFLMHLLELIKKSESDYPDAGAFLEYFEQLEGDELYVELTDTDAVKIMTVHKAKGLQFPVVIIAHLAMDVQIGNSADYDRSYILEEGDAQMGLLRLKSKYCQFSEKLAETHAREYKKSFITELNNMYVALTRPQYELYAFIPKRIGNAHNIAQLLIPCEHYEMGKKAVTSKKPQPVSEVIALSLPRYMNWLHFLKDEFTPATEIYDRQERLRGEVIHFLLAQIEAPLENVQTAIDSAIDQGQLVFPHVENWTDYRDLLSKIIEAPNLKAFFFVKEAKVYNEWEVVTAAGHTKRIDRLIVGKLSVSIVDYKSSRELLPEQEAQMQEYIALIKQLYLKHEVRGYLVYLNTLEVKEVT